MPRLGQAGKVQQYPGAPCWAKTLKKNKNDKDMSKGPGSWDFPGGPVVKTSLSSTGGANSIPGQGAKTQCLVAKTLNTKQKQYYNEFQKDF